MSSESVQFLVDELTLATEQAPTEQLHDASAKLTAFYTGLLDQVGTAGQTVNTGTFSSAVKKWQEVCDRATDRKPSEG